LKLFKSLILVICLILSTTIFPTSEFIINNEITIDLPFYSDEKEIYTIRGVTPFDFDVKNDSNLFQVSISKIVAITMTDTVKNNNQSQLESKINSSKLALITFHLQEYPYYYSHYYFPYKTLIVEVNKHSQKRLYKKVIVIDPGHGAYSDEKELWDYYDCGVIGSTGVYESVINLQIAQLVQKGLEENGATVIMTREMEKNRNNLRFAQRGLLVNDLMPDAFISIHQNGSIYKDVSGTVVYYSNPVAYQLANSIAKEIVQNTPLHLRYLFNGKFELIESMKLSAKILIECGFLSNTTDEKILIDQANQEKIASAIVQGIINFFENS
jgi:N-acetylmuramoyl-L-alanine amidase